MKEYRRCAWSYCKDLLLTVLATAVAYAGAWTLGRFVLAESLPSAVLDVIVYGVPALICAGMLYVTFVVDAVKLTLRQDGQVGYYKAGAKPLFWDAKQAWFDWLNYSQVSGNTTPHDITLRVTELNGEVAEVDCGSLGRRRFIRFMQSVEEYALWRRPGDVATWFPVPPEIQQVRIEQAAHQKEMEQEVKTFSEEAAVPPPAKKIKEKKKKKNKKIETPAVPQEIAPGEETPLPIEAISPIELSPPTEISAQENMSPETQPIEMKETVETQLQPTLSPRLVPMVPISQPWTEEGLLAKTEEVEKYSIPAELMPVKMDEPTNQVPPSVPENLPPTE